MLYQLSYASRYKHTILLSGNSNCKEKSFLTCTPSVWFPPGLATPSMVSIAFQAWLADSAQSEIAMHTPPSAFASTVSGC